MANKQDKARKHRPNKKVKKIRSKAPKQNGVHGYAHKNVALSFRAHI